VIGGIERGATLEAREVERQQRPLHCLDRGRGCRDGVDHRHAGHLVLFEAGVERIGDAAGEQRCLFGVGHHRRQPVECQPALICDHRAAISDDQELRPAAFQVALGGVENPFVEGADKALLGRKHDHNVPFGASGFARRRFGCRHERERLPDRSADRRRIGADAVEPAACFARAGSRTAPHRRDHRFELMDRADAAFDFAELAAHDVFAC
jgi:hypothetical protein